MNPNLFTKCPVLFEDDTLIVVNKPSGALSHPNRTHPLSTKKPPACAYEGHYDFGNRKFTGPGGPLWLIHRLDQDASGALLAAKNEFAARRCRFLFEHYEVQRSYLSLIVRQPEPQQGKWRDRLSEEKRKKFIRALVESRGRPNAELIYQVKKYFPAYRLSLIQFDLVTGKTHQIRIQAAHHGHPIAGDDIYGDFKLNRRLRKSIGLRRLFLHAFHLKLKHPASDQKVDVQAPLPEELERCLAQMS